MVPAWQSTSPKPEGSSQEFALRGCGPRPRVRAERHRPSTVPVTARCSCEAFYDAAFSASISSIGLEVVPRSKSPSRAATTNPEELSPRTLVVVRNMSRTRSMPATMAIPSSGSPTDSRTSVSMMRPPPGMLAVPYGGEHGGEDHGQLLGEGQLQSEGTRDEYRAHGLVEGRSVHVDRQRQGQHKPGHPRGYPEVLLCPHGKREGRCRRTRAKTDNCRLHHLFKKVQGVHPGEGAHSDRLGEKDMDEAAKEDRENQLDHRHQDGEPIFSGSPGN